MTDEAKRARTVIAPEDAIAEVAKLRTERDTEITRLRETTIDDRRREMFFSNEEARTAPEDYRPAQVMENGHVKGPECCGQRMADDGGCSFGCCDDYRCTICGHTVRIKWPD